MKAFSFRSSKKTQQSQHQQPQQQQRSRTNFQLSLSLSKSRTSQDQSRHDQIPTPSLTPSPVPSPVHSTISFGAVSAGSLGTAHSHGPKSRPSLSLLRPSVFHSTSNDGHPSPYLHHNATEPQPRGRSPIYSRFGFNRSTPQLPHPSEVFDPPSSAKSTSTFVHNYNKHPPMPTRPTPPPPMTPSKKSIEPTSQFIELPIVAPPIPATPPPKLETHISRRSPGRPSLSIDGLQVPSDNAVSTSTLLQRRRAKSLGTSNGSGDANDTTVPRVTNLIIPPLVIDQTPLSLQSDSPKSASPISSLPTPTTPSNSLLPPIPMSAPLQKSTFLSYPHSHSPSPVPSRSQSPAYKHRSESSSLRSRSESNSSSRTRSESNSSRARSESNASTSSSSRHGHKSARASVRATMLKLDDVWSGFLKEVDEDLAELSGARSEEMKDGLLSPDYPLTPSETLKSPLVRPILPLRSRSPSVGRATPSSKGSDSGFTSRSQTPTISNTPKTEIASPSRQNDSVFVTVSSSISSQTVASPGGGGVGTEAGIKGGDSVSSLPYLYSPDPSFIHSSGPRSLKVQNSPNRSAPSGVGPSILINLPTSSEPAHAWTPNTTPNLNSMTPNVNRISTATFDSEDSRPGSSYSQMSQFSLSMFPSPPSVPVIRPTTENGTFRVGPASNSPNVSEDGHGALKSDDGPGSARTLRFKPIVQPSSAGRGLIRSLFSKEGREGGSRSVTPTPSESAYSHSTLSSPGYGPAQVHGLGVHTEPSSPSSLSTHPPPLQTPAKEPNYDALLKSMERRGSEGVHGLFVQGPVGVGATQSSLFDPSGTSRPGTADSKFQWGYAL